MMMLIMITMLNDDEKDDNDLRLWHNNDFYTRSSHEKLLAHGNN